MISEQQNTALLKDPAWAEYLAELRKTEDRNKTAKVCRNCKECGKPQTLGVLDGERMWFGTACVHAARLTAKETEDIHLYTHQQYRKC